MPFKVFEDTDIGRSLFAAIGKETGGIMLHEIERDGEIEGEGSMVPE